MKYTSQEVKQFVEEEDVKFIRLAFSDIFGKSKNISIMPDELPRALEDGIAFDASANHLCDLLCCKFHSFWYKTSFRFAKLSNLVEITANKQIIYIFFGIVRNIFRLLDIDEVAHHAVADEKSASGEVDLVVVDGEKIVFKRFFSIFEQIIAKFRFERGQKNAFSRAHR